MPSGPQHSGTTLLVIPITDEMHGGGRRREAAMGRKLRSSGEADDGRGEERRTHATLHGAHLLGKPGLLLFPPQSVGVRAPSQEARQSLPQPHIN